MVYDKDYAKYYDLFYKGKDYSEEVDFLKKILDRFGRKPVKILNLGCGTGAHDKDLVNEGYRITGMDLSEEMIAIAKNKVPDAKFVVGDIANFELNEKFDVIICMFSVLGYLNENKQIKGFFDSCKRHLSDGGLLILDVWNGLGVMRELPTSREKSVEIGELRIVRKSYPDLDPTNHLNKIRFNVKVFDNGELIKDYDEDHKVRFFFPLEIRKYMEDVGFEVKHLCPSFEIDKKLGFEWNMVVVGELKSNSLE
jgi:SAM-dependent methyltransferase